PPVTDRGGSRGIAQPGRAPVLGTGGRVFESHYPDQRFKRTVMAARIFRPAPNAMQSGRGKSKDWVLLFEPASPREIEPLMGYTSSDDTQAQVKLSFPTLEEAEAYARSNGIPYTVQPPHSVVPKRSSYTDNFRPDRKPPWT